MVNGAGKKKGSGEEEVSANKRLEDEETAASDVEETVEESAASGEAEAFRAPEFRRDYPEDGRSSDTPAPPPGDAFFVAVTKGDGTAFHRFDDPIKAKTFVERLLDEGVGEGEVSAFAARKLSLQVSRRPVVTLLTNED